MEKKRILEVAMNSREFKSYKILSLILVLAALLLTACGSNPLAGPARQVQAAEEQSASVRYTLKTDLVDGKVAFIGQGGEIDGMTNPALPASPGQTVRITLLNGDGGEHNLAVPGAGIESESLSSAGSETSVSFKVHQEGSFAYYSSVSSDREDGLQGWLVVGRSISPAELPAASMNDSGHSSTSGSTANASTSAQSAEPAAATSIVRDPADLSGPLGDRPPRSIHYDIETVELVGQLADGTTFTYWTFGGQVPGPFLRVRVGDTVEISLSSPADSSMVH
jgi:nitrite reductase (NO-forming)